jgi:hypothetical protein
MMTIRERFRAAMDFRPFDRLPVVEWASWWDKTIARWRTEGLPAECRTRTDIVRHFGLDVWRQDWLDPRRPGCPEEKSHGAGIVEDEKGYEAVRPLLFPRPAVDAARWAAWAEEQARGDCVLWFTVEGFFWFPRTILGIERHLYAFYDQPALIHRINEDLAAWILGVLEELDRVCVPDFMTFAEDLSYNRGPMLSKECFDEFLRPYYDLVVPALKKRGILAIVDSDGDVHEPARWFEEAGLDGILPLERQSGVDVARLRREHPRMRFVGAFDKRVMHRGEGAIRAEFDRLLPVAASGGFLPSCDHQTPPEVSYQDYRLYLSVFREYAEEAGKRSARDLA